MILNFIKLARPKQWVKNFFVFAPLLFSKHVFDGNYVITALSAFFIFCLVSSTVYIINDIMDVESDRSHPKKKFRPIASGELSVRQALIFFTVLIGIIILLSVFQKPVFTFVIVLYFLSNLIYSIKIKSIVLLDVFFISFGFMLRVLGGAAAIDVSVSSWMILTTIFISLFLAISKRRGELSQVVNHENIEKQRKVLREYSVEFADQLNTIAAAGTIISYALYTVSERTVTTFGTDKLIYTTPFVIYGIFRYMYLMHKKNLGESPTTIVTKDIPIMLVVLIYFIACIIIIYKPSIPVFSNLARFIFPEF
jgi:4-hydroxybenzoate polyprenyltransferase